MEASKNLDGSANFNVKVPIAGRDADNTLSALGSLNNLQSNGAYSSAGGGLALETAKGHALSMTGTHIPAFGNVATASGTMNLMNTPDHNLNANAFVSKNMPKHPMLPNHTTKGASVDYNFRNTVGASAGVAHTPLFKKTEYSAGGHLNLMNTNTSSLNLNAGVSKSVSPFMPKTGWQPNVGLTFNKRF